VKKRKRPRRYSKATKERAFTLSLSGILTLTRPVTLRLDGGEGGGRIVNRTRENCLVREKCVGPLDEIRFESGAVGSLFGRRGVRKIRARRRFRRLLLLPVGVGTIASSSGH